MLLNTNTAMKKLYIFSIGLFLIIILSALPNLVSAQIITVSDVPTALCAHESFTISYDGSSQTYNSGNVFTVELSASDGSYPGTSIGSLVSTDQVGTIYCTIPTATTFSSSYSIRVSTSNSILGSFSGTPSGAININCTTRDYYWTGGTGNWSDLSHWEYTTDDVTFTAATEPPLSTDNVLFDENSFPSGGQVTINVSATCNDMYWDPASGINNPTIYSNGNSLSVYGDFELAPGVYNELYYVYFYPDKYNIYLDFGDNLFEENIYKRNYYLYNSYSYDLNSDIKGNRLYLYNGTLTTNDFDITLEYRLYITGTINAGFSVIKAPYVQVSGTFNGSASTVWMYPTDYYNSLYLYGTGNIGSLIIESSTCNISGGNNMNDLTLLNGGGVNLSAGTIQTITNSLTIQGSRSKLSEVKSNSTGSPATLLVTGATVSVNFAEITDNIIDNGSAIVNVTAFNSKNNGGNTGWDFTLVTPLDFRWIGGSGDWDDVSHWESSTVGVNTYSAATAAPGYSDNTFFTTNSFPSGGTLTLNSTYSCNNMTWESGSADNSPVIYSSYPNELVIRGSLALTDGVTRDLYRLNFNSTSAGNTIDLANNLTYYGDIDFNGTGEWTLMSDLVTTWLNLRGGTLNTNNRTITVEEQIYLDYQNTGTVNWSSSIVNLRSLFCDSPTITFNSQTSTFNFQAINGGTCEFNGGYPVSFNTVNILNDLFLSNAYTFNNLSFSPGVNVQLEPGITQTVNNSFVAEGTRSQMINIGTYSPGNTATLFINTAIASLSVDYAIIQDNILDNGSGFTTTENATRSLDNGNNTGWNFSVSPLTSMDYYWTGETGNWSDVNHWVTTDGGSTQHDDSPGVLDNVYFTSNAFTSDGTLTLDYPVAVHSMDWTGNTSFVSIFEDGNYDNSLTIGGSFILVDGVSRDFSQLIFDSDETGLSIDFADNSRGYNQVTFFGTGEWSLASDFDADEARFYSGTFYTNGFDFSSYYIRLDDNNISFWGNSDVYVREFSSYGLYDPLTFNSENSTFYFEQAYNYIDSYGSVFNNVYFDGDCEIYGSNIFNNASLNTGTLYSYDDQTFGTLVMEAGTMMYAYDDQSFGTLTIEEGSALFIQDGSTQTISTELDLNGTEDNPVIVNSTYDGFAGIFSASFGVPVNADFVHLKDNVATGGATFSASNSSDFGNVTGWSGLKTGQTIDFGILNDTYQDDGSFNIAATASSALDVSFEIAFGPAATSGSNGTIITPTGSGLVGIKAIQTGNSTYGVAAPVLQYMHINASHEPNELGNFKEAKVVLGQLDNYSNIYEYTDISTPYPWQVAVSRSGKMAVANGSRVLIWNQIPSSPDTPADVVVGHSDFITEYEGIVSASTFVDEVYSVAFTHDNKLLVADEYRILIWNTIPTSNGVAADFVIGQPDFTSTFYGTGPNRFGAGDIKSIATYYNEENGTEKLLISDFDNSRVLIYNSIPVFNDASADNVIGQQDMFSNYSGSGADQLNRPIHLSVAPDGKLFIADYANSRVVVFNSIPDFDGAFADMVLGQSDFGQSDYGTGPTQFGYPTGVSVSRTGKLAISEYGNHRVLIYKSIPLNNTTPPDFILGQPDAISNVENYYSISARTLSYPIGVNWDLSENLFISDSDNNRVLLYGAADLESPVVESFTLLEPSYIMGASDQKTTFTLSDRSGISEVIGYYNDVNHFDNNNPSYEQIFLTDIGSNTYEFDLSVIESLSSSPTGIEYYIEARDNFGNFVSTIDNKQVLPIYYPDGITINGYGVGSATENYRIMAVPAELDNQAVEHVFQSIFGGSYDNTKMRVFSYPGGSATGYNEAIGSTNLKVGSGYFALAATGSGSSVTSPDGALTSFISTDDGSGENIHEFVINLVNGWNLIGNPFQHAIIWSDVQSLSGFANGDIDQLQDYTGTYNNITSIAAGKGAFVFNGTGSNYSLRIPARINTGGRIAGISENDNPLTESSWEVWLRAFDANNDEIVLGGIGMEVDAVLSKDQYDWLNPPAFSRMKLIEFNHPEFSEPSFKKDIRQASNEEKWSFIYKVDNPTNSLHELHWDNAHIGESSPDLYLVDKTHFAMINMKEENSYSFNHGGLTEFEIYFGANALEAIMPEEFMTQSPYPNPFTHDVTFNIGLPLDEKYSIEVMVFDSMGKIVRKLSKDNVVSGYNSIVWDGLNTDGRLLPSGIYAYSIYVNGVNVNAVKSGKLIKR